MSACVVPFATPEAEERRRQWEEDHEEITVAKAAKALGIDVTKLPGADHLSGWRKRSNGEAVIVSQPFDLDGEVVAAMLVEMDAFARRHGVTFSIGATRSWRCPGATVLVAWTKEGGRT